MVLSGALYTCFYCFENSDVYLVIPPRLLEWISSPTSLMFGLDDVTLMGYCMYLGSNATPKDEFLGLLTWGYASPALQQFLALSLGETVRFSSSRLDHWKSHLICTRWMTVVLRYVWQRSEDSLWSQLGELYAVTFKQSTFWSQPAVCSLTGVEETF